MKLPRHISLPAVALALTFALGTTGCTTETAPSPTPTALVFETDEEAYAAAEEVYRAFLDEYNSMKYDDSKELTSLEKYMSGDFLLSTRKGFSQLHADQIGRVGETKVVWIRGVSRTEDNLITMLLCEDITTVDLRDADGISLVNPERDNFPARIVDFRIRGDSIRVDDAVLTEDEECGR